MIMTRVGGVSIVLYYISLWPFSQYKPEEMHVIGTQQQIKCVCCCFQLH